MIDALADLIDGGRLKLYCVDSADAETWSDRTLPTEERARRHDGYERWILDEVLPWIDRDCRGQPDVATLGCSLGAYHAVNLALRHADRFPLAIGLSGSYDPTKWHGWGEVRQMTYFHNPMAYVPNLQGDHLGCLRRRHTIRLVGGEGAWEVDRPAALPSTRGLTAGLAEKGIRHELDVWG